MRSRSAQATAAGGRLPGQSDALGVSRTIVVDPREHGRIGTMSYAETLPLADKEVVLTFDDGPIPPYTGKILDILASECVQGDLFHRRQHGAANTRRWCGASTTTATPSAPTA